MIKIIPAKKFKALEEDLATMKAALDQARIELARSVGATEEMLKIIDSAKCPNLSAACKNMLKGLKQLPPKRP